MNKEVSTSEKGEEMGGEIPPFLLNLGIDDWQKTDGSWCRLSLGFVCKTLLMSILTSKQEPQCYRLR